MNKDKNPHEVLKFKVKKRCVIWYTVEINTYWTSVLLIFAPLELVFY